MLAPPPAIEVKEVQLPPRVEPLRLSRILVTPCVIDGDAPLPDQQPTPRNGAHVASIIADERDCNRYRMEQIGKQPGVILIDP